MIKVILVRLLLLALPFLLYAAYMKAVKKRDILDAETWKAAPLLALTTSALLIVAASFVYLALTSGADPGGDYTPARYEDGELVPGSVDPPDRD